MISNRELFYYYLIFITYLYKFIYHLKFICKYISEYKNVKEYTFKLDGYYFSKNKQCHLAVIRVRNKRITRAIPIKEVVSDKKFIRALHPVDACIVGIIANNERNGIIDYSHIGWQKMFRIKEYRFIENQTLLSLVTKL